MKLAINYLTEVISLLNEKKIKVDYIKYPSVSDTNLKEMDHINSKIPNKILLHGSISCDYSVQSFANATFQEKLDVTATKQALAKSAEYGLSIHIGEPRLSFKGRSREQLVSSCVDNILYVQKSFPNLKFLTTENREHNTIIEDPSFIKEVVEKSGCLFLFDVSHAARASKYRNMDIYEYIQLLPMDKLYEIHLNGWDYLENGEFVSHTKTNEKGYEVLEYLLENYHPEIVTIEYGQVQQGQNIILLNNMDEDMDIVKQEVMEQIQRVSEIMEKYCPKNKE